jgi:peptidoglycan/xylan/chitin deacetylase (PgdA/CDA1 family)
MILILTYHEVRPGHEGQSDFYTVSPERFQQQLDLLAGSGLKAISPDDLMNLQPGTNGYLLTFDDGTVDHCEVVLPLLEEHKLRAIFFIPTAKLDRPGYMSSAQAGEIGRCGHALGLHSHEHRRMDELGEEDIRVQMEISRARLGEVAGTPPVFFAPPGGYLNRRVQGIAVESGVKIIRTMRWGYNNRLNPLALECIPINRRSHEKEFGQVLKLRNRSALYTAKQVTKKLLPARAYELLRGAVFGSSDRN